jgi:hypothetical protein
MTESKLVKGMAAILKKSSISKKNLGKLLNSIHFALPWAILGVVFIGPKWLATLAVIFLGLILLSLVFMGGSWLTMLTQEVTGKDDHIIDPFVELLRMETTDSNRGKVLWITGIWLVIITGGIYYLRFIAENPIFKKILSDDLDVKEAVNMVRGAVVQT